MERWILVLCHERPQLADLRGEWQKKGISVRIVSDVGEAAGELSGNTDYLLVIIFFGRTGVFTFIKNHKGIDKGPGSGGKPAV